MEGITKKKTQLTKLKESLDNKLIDDSLKAKMRESIKTLEAEIKDLEKKEAAQQEDKRNAEAKAKEAAEVKAEQEEQEKKEKAAKRKKGKVSKQNAPDCAQLIDNVRKELAAFKAEHSPKPKPRRKKSSATVALGIVRPIQSIARREMTSDKVHKIRVERLEEAKDHFAKGLAQIKLAFGGINDSNSTILKNFNKEMGALIKEIEQLQKAKQEAKKAS